jgi:quercetin dioxygenase-like cupin family protein
MEIKNLSEMTGGWFVGDFEPSAFRTKDFEVGIKVYEAGTRERWHYHMVATELTVIVSGEAEFNGLKYGPGSIVLIPPGKGTDFHAIEATTTVVVKVPSVAGDKFFNDYKVESPS